MRIVIDDSDDLFNILCTEGRDRGVTREELERVTGANRDRPPEAVKGKRKRRGKATELFRKKLFF